MDMLAFENHKFCKINNETFYTMDFIYKEKSIIFEDCGGERDTRGDGNLYKFFFQINYIDGI